MSEPTFPRAFVAQRDTDISGVSGEGIVAEGVQFSDGWVVTHWLDQPPMHEPKTDVWHNPGVQPFERVHGHGGATRVVWADDVEQLVEQRNRAQAYPFVTVHGDSAMSREARDALGALADVAVQQMADKVRSDQAEDLLRVAHDTSNRSEAERARAVRRAEQLAAVLREVLGLFTPALVNGKYAFYQATGSSIAPEDYQRWHAALDGTEQHNRTATQATGPAVCDAYQPPSTPEYSGLCARCGMYDYRHRAENKERP